MAIGRGAGRGGAGRVMVGVNLDGSFLLSYCSFDGKARVPSESSINFALLYFLAAFLVLLSSERRQPGRAEF